MPLISPAAYYAARAEGVPVVQALHNYRLLCPNALFYRDGISVPKDTARAETLFAWACKEDDGLACHNLAGMVRARDPDRARALENEGCDKKDKSACEAVGRPKPKK